MKILTQDYINTIAEDLARTVSHPEFLKRMLEVREGETNAERIARAGAVAPDELRKAGVPVPDTLRVTPRTFEKPEFADVNGIQSFGREPGSEKETAWESYGSMPPEAYDTSTWGDENVDYPTEMKDPEFVRQTVYEAVLEIGKFAMTEPFNQALVDLMAAPSEERPAFVLNNLLNQTERERRGIHVPENMRIQRSTFYDGRPTLFCVSMLTPLAYPWRKITITFDNDGMETLVKDQLSAPDQV
ncbi:MAG TPA: hypothetical protein VM943_00485 [Pyrinomonadaceae bacterium]|nr:hypothetical protein [Pyrinomonadaceae bacterium]